MAATQPGAYTLKCYATKLAHISPQQARQEIFRHVPDKELFAYITELKKHYKIGLLSNIVGGYLEQVFTDGQLEQFDNQALSFEIGFRKPQPEAYVIAAQQLGLEPAECVLIDDQEHNVAGAHAAGMPALLYHDAARLKQDLPELLQAA